MPNQDDQLSILCLASYEKGFDFFREAKRLGCRVLLLTSQSLEEAAWPRDSIDEIYYVPDQNKKWELQDVIYGVSYIARQELFQKIVALDDFDVETAAALREHLRVAGMGETTSRYFRDKLAMRMRAQERGILVPGFVHVLNHQKINEFLAHNPGPWLIKPRFEASATGIRKIDSHGEILPAVNSLGDRASFHLMESYVAGEIFHVDSIISNAKVVFALASKYGNPPMDVAHAGGIFTTRNLPPDEPDAQALLELNARTLEAMGHSCGVSHTEFIKAHKDGRFYFLETSARVGGAHIVEMVEAASGVNLWREWARVEIEGSRGYQIPEYRREFAGLIVSLARQEQPDTSAYNDAEIAWRLNKSHHAGLIVKSANPARIEQLLHQYSGRFYQDFYATQPLPRRPQS